MNFNHDGISVLFTLKTDVNSHLSFIQINFIFNQVDFFRISQKLSVRRFVKEKGCTSLYVFYRLFFTHLQHMLIITSLLYNLVCVCCKFFWTFYLKTQKKSTQDGCWLRYYCHLQMFEKKVLFSLSLFFGCRRLWFSFTSWLLLHSLILALLWQFFVFIVLVPSSICSNLNRLLFTFLCFSCFRHVLWAELPQGTGNSGCHQSRRHHYASLSCVWDPLNKKEKM